MSLTKISYSMIDGAAANVLDFGADPTGATDSSIAFTNAIRSGAKKVIIPNPDAGKQWLLTNPVNVTALLGIHIECEGSLYIDIPPILVKHTGVAFDCTGSVDLLFTNVRVEGSAITTPTAGWFLARLSTAASSGRHRFYNCGSTGKFLTAPYYNYASEENNHYSCIFINNQSNGRSILITEKNVSSLSSSFQTIATGIQSCTQLIFFGGSFFAQGNGGLQEEAAFYIEGGGDISLYSAFLYCPYGKSQIYIDQSSSTTNFVILDGVRFEVSSPLPKYCVYFSNGVSQSPSFWSIRNCRMPTDVSTGYGVYAEDNTTISNFVIDNNQAASGLGILSYKQIANSFINYAACVIEARTSGTTLNTEFIGYKGGVSIPKGSESGNFIVETNGWTAFTSDISGLTIVGALTISSSYKREGNTITYKIIMSAVTSITCANGTAIFNAASTTLPGPSIYDGGLVSVFNNTVGIAIGTGGLRTSSGKTGIYLPAVNVTTDQISIYATAQVF